MFSKLAYSVFEQSIRDYHQFDSVDQPIKNPFPKDAEQRLKQKTGYNISTKIAILQNCTNTPLLGGLRPATSFWYPWDGTRNVCMATDRNQIVVVDTAGLGNVFVTSNGLQSAPWPDSSSLGGISCFTDVINLSIPNAVSQVAVPRSGWSGVCVNYNDQFAFANRTGTVYLYTWTLQ